MGNIIFQMSKTTHLGHPPPRDLSRDDEHDSDLSPCNCHEIDVCVDKEDEDFVIVNGTDPYYDQISTEEFVFVAHGSYESGSML